MSSGIGDAICPQHGWMSHVFIHEAAHAVAALDRSIPFSGVFVADPANWVQRNASDTMLGGVQIDPDPAVWLLPNPVAALEFVLAGSTAENIALQHILDGSYTGDLQVWRVGIGATDALDRASLDNLAGGSFADVVQRTREWVVEAWPRIRSVAAALSGSTSIGGGMQMAGAGPWSLTPEQVAAASR